MTARLPPRSPPPARSSTPSPRPPPPTPAANCGRRPAAFERASRSHIRAEYAARRRPCARPPATSCTAGPRSAVARTGPRTAMVHRHAVLPRHRRRPLARQAQHAQQAEAARRAAEHLRAAYQQAAAEPLTVLRERGRRIAPSLRRQPRHHLRAAVPELAETDPGRAWLGRPGRHPRRRRADRPQRRTLFSPRPPHAGNWTRADSVSDVLVWRLRRIAGLPAYPTTTAPGGKGQQRTRWVAQAQPPSAAPRLEQHQRRR